MGVLKALVAEPLDDTNQIYRVWQQTLLAQMGIGGGIGGWALQDSEVVAVELAGHFAEPVAGLAAKPAAANPVVAKSCVTDTPHIDASPVLLATPDAPVAPTTAPKSAPSFLPSVPPRSTPVPTAKPVLATSALTEQPATAPNTAQSNQSAQAVQRLNLQIIAYKDWCIIADDAILRQDSRQAELWYNIATGLRSQSQLYTFPLLENFGSFPPSYVTRMLSRHNALASFHGFCQSLLMRMPRLGALTALPPCFEGEPIARLPQLAQMLQNTAAKRILWDALNGSD